MLAEYPEYDTQERAREVEEIFREAAQLEVDWAREVIGEKIDGLDVEDVEAYIILLRKCALQPTRLMTNHSQNIVKIH